MWGSHVISLSRPMMGYFLLSVLFNLKETIKTGAVLLNDRAECHSKWDSEVDHCDHILPFLTMIHLKTQGLFLLQMKSPIWCVILTFALLWNMEYIPFPCRIFLGLFLVSSFASLSLVLFSPNTFFLDTCQTASFKMSTWPYHYLKALSEESADSLGQPLRELSGLQL